MTVEYHINKHGIEGIKESSGHFGRFTEQGRFEMNLPIFIPRVCLDCIHYDPGEMGDYGSKIGAPYCELNCFFPVRRGSCKRKKARQQQRKETIT